ncbi:MAG: hypothetical protein SFV51_02865 [Bryobacteraceae bacterium]|nr:hypothetical protein [Bryobacteraceae bacterium]
MRLLAMLALSVFSLAQGPPPVPADPGVKTGERLPSFKLKDQDGKERDFRSLRGRKGLMLVFFRSADW